MLGILVTSDVSERNERNDWSIIDRYTFRISLIIVNASFSHSPPYDPAVE